MTQYNPNEGAIVWVKVDPERPAVQRLARVLHPPVTRDDDLDGVPAGTLGVHVTWDDERFLPHVRFVALDDVRAAQDGGQA